MLPGREARGAGCGATDSGCAAQARTSSAARRQNFLAQLLLLFGLEAVGIRTRVGTCGVRNGRDELDRTFRGREALGLCESFAAVVDGATDALRFFNSSAVGAPRFRTGRSGSASACASASCGRRCRGSRCALPRRAASGPAGPNRRPVPRAEAAEGAGAEAGGAGEAGPEPGGRRGWSILGRLRFRAGTPQDRRTFNRLGSRLRHDFLPLGGGFLRRCNRGVRLPGPVSRPRCCCLAGRW